MMVRLGARRSARPPGCLRSSENPWSPMGHAETRPGIAPLQASEIIDLRPGFRRPTAPTSTARGDRLAPWSGTRRPRPAVTIRPRIPPQTLENVDFRARNCVARPCRLTHSRRPSHARERNAPAAAGRDNSPIRPEIPPQRLENMDSAPGIATGSEAPPPIRLPSSCGGHAGGMDRRSE